MIKMSEEDLRIQQIKMKIKGLTFEQARDISNLCSEYYIEGLEQSRFDKRMLEQENQQLKEIEKEHQKINGELREENKKLKEQVEDLKADYGTIAQIERDLYKDVIEMVREYISELLQILDKVKEIK